MQIPFIPTTFQDNADLLKKALLQYPRRYHHEFSHKAKIDLRRVLYFAASHKGDYMKHLFPEVNESVLPKAWQHVLAPERYQHLEEEDFYFQRAEFNDFPHPNRSCGRKFKKGEPVYRCLTCGKDESSGICSHCYSEDSHKDHDVVIGVCQRENGGVCDCGDFEAWNTTFNCKHTHQKEVSLEEIPKDFQESLLQTFEIALDYVVDVLSSSSITHIKEKKQDSESILKDNFKSTLDTEKYFGTDWSSDLFYLLLYNDQNRQYRDAIQGICAATNKVEDFAYMVTDEVNANGRAKVLGSTHIDQLLGAQRILDAAGLPSTIRSARDIFREEMCAEIISWLNEMCAGSILGNYNIARDLTTEAFCKKWDIGITISPEIEVYFPGSLINYKIPLETHPKSFHNEKNENWATESRPWKLDKDLLAQCDYDPCVTSSDKSVLLHGSRFQYLLYFDIRLWKTLRFSLHNLFNSILTTNKRFRSIICSQYVDIYPTMLELFFLFDREPEYSCMTSLTSQIFTSTSNASLIADHGDLTRFLAAAYGFLTKMHVVRPEDVDTSQSLSLSSFKNRKIGQVFFDMCCVLSKTESLENILSEKFVTQVCDVLMLFQGRPNFRREALEHVEYETNDYGLYFNMYSVISSMSEIIARSFSHAESETVCRLIALIISRISNSIFSGDLNAPPDIGPLNFKEVNTIEGSIGILDFTVHNGQMSFLHPLHAFLSWAIQYSKLSDFDLVSQYYLDDVGAGSKNIFLDYPLRVIVMLSQIKVGIWVRNGFSIRNQLHIYQTSGIRESGYKRDMYLVQLMMTLCKPEFSLTTIFGRWSLLPWLKEEFKNHTDYDENGLPLVVEECLLFFINALSEDTYLTQDPKTIPLRCMKEIIHTLCFKPLSYSKLCAEIPDFISHEKCFDLYLKKVSDFIPGKSENSSGVYRLKEDYYDQIDPYYIHYSSNKRDDASKLLKERRSKKFGMKPEEAIIEPKVLDLDGTLFSDLYKVTSSKIFVLFLRSTLKFINNEGLDKTDTILESTLHLIHMAIQGKNYSYSSRFNENIWSELRADHNEPFFYESVGSILYKFLKDNLFSAHHPKIRAIFASLVEKSNSVEAYLKEQVEIFDPAVLKVGFLDCPDIETEFDKKKRMAKERRAKIMAKFKKRQSKFVEKNGVDPQSDDTIKGGGAESTYWKYPEDHCILCQMPSTSDDIFGVVCNISNVMVSRNIPFQDKYWSLRAYNDVQSMDAADTVDHKGELQPFFSEVQGKTIFGPSFVTSNPRDILEDITASSCGHGMHYSCYKNHLLSSKGRQTQITRTVPEDFENSEYICPLCKSLGNLFVPVIWSQNKNSLNSFVEGKQNWYDAFELLKEKSVSDPEILYHFANQQISRALSAIKSCYEPVLYSRAVGVSSKFSHIWVKMIERITKTSKPHFRDHMSRLIANLVKLTEISLRGTESDDGLVVKQLTHQTLTTLRIMIEFRKTWLASICYDEVKQDSKGMFGLKVSEEMIARLQLLASREIFDSYQEADFFEYIVSCCEMDELPSSSIYRLGLIHTVIQTLATLIVQLKECAFDGDFNISNLDTVKADEKTLHNLLSVTRALRDNHPIFDNLSDDVFESPEFPAILYTLLARSITPFLRKLAIWVFGNCGDLTGCNLDFSIDEGLEIDRLAVFLKLPTLSQLISSFIEHGTVEYSKFREFIGHIQTTDNDLTFRDIEYPGTIKLIDLPEKMDDIFTKVIYKSKEFKRKGPVDPAICLVCGTIVNLQKKAPGSKKGECNQHVDEQCLSNVGIFLLPKHSSMLLLSRGNGSFYPAPYVDHNGDDESDARQGQVLTLSQAKYLQFTKQMWLQNNITNYITRKLEGTIDIGGWESL